MKAKRIQENKIAHGTIEKIHALHFDESEYRKTSNLRVRLKLGFLRQ